MLDTAVQHTQDRDLVLKILRFGTKQLFEKEQESSKEGYQVDEKTLKTVLDRDAQFQEIEDEVAVDYLAQFKVAEFKNQAPNVEEPASDEDAYFKNLNLRLQ